MQISFRRRKTVLIVIPICVVLAFIFGHALFKLDKKLSTTQFLLVIVLILLFTSIIELVAVWWGNKHKNQNALKSFHDLVGREGTIVEDCNPEGKIKINQEIWNAISKSGLALRSGEKIKVIERQGLQLFVEKTS